MHHTPRDRRVLDEHDRRESAVADAVDAHTRDRLCPGGGARRLDVAGQRIVCSCTAVAYVTRAGIVAAHFRP